MSEEEKTPEQNQLEKDFNEIKDAVNAKLKEAATAIREAQALAKAKGMSLMSYDESDYRDTACINADYDLDLEFDVRQIESAMSNAGWQTSSWHC